MGTPLQITAPALANAAAVPAELFPVAVLARTCTLELQDPRASLRRQIRTCKVWLPAGWFIAAVYWDIESGALNLEARSQGDAYRAFAGAGIPRDGGLADLLTVAKAPAPKFAVVVCEDIERSGRDTFNALKLEKELPARECRSSRPTSPPPSKESTPPSWCAASGSGWRNGTGCNCGRRSGKGSSSIPPTDGTSAPSPTDTCRESHSPQPDQGCPRADKDPADHRPRARPVVTVVFTWRTASKLAVPTITARLNADPAAYPSPDGTGWTQTTVTGILGNPKYTGEVPLKAWTRFEGNLG
jgi:site-specific DNA recombinase